MHNGDNSVQRLTRPCARQGQWTAMTNVWPKLQDLRLESPESHDSRWARGFPCFQCRSLLACSLTHWHCPLPAHLRRLEPMLAIGTRPLQAPRSGSSITDEHGHVNVVDGRPVPTPPGTGDKRQRGRRGTNKDHWLGRRHVAVIPTWQWGRSRPQISQPSAGNWMRARFFSKPNPWGISLSRLPGTWSP